MPDLHASIETFLKMTPGHKADVTLSRDYDITMGIPSKSDALVLGDVAGHEFHGNQYSQAASAAHNKAAKNGLDDDGDFDKASDNARDATNEAWDKNTPELHEAAAVSNRHAAEVGKETLDNFPDAPHVPYPPSRFEDEGYNPLEKHLEARGAIQKAIKAHLSDAVEHETIAAAHAATKAANAGDHGDYEGNEAKHNAATDAWTKVADMMHAAGRSPQDVRDATAGPLMHHSGQAYHYHKMIQREKE